jgi:hypothetical protein
MEVPKNPVVFHKTVSTLNNPGDFIDLPKIESKPDWCHHPKHHAHIALSGESITESQSHAAANVLLRAVLQGGGACHCDRQARLQKCQRGRGPVLRPWLHRRQRCFRARMADRARWRAVVLRQIVAFASLLRFVFVRCTWLQSCHSRSQHLITPCTHLAGLTPSRRSGQ